MIDPIMPLSETALDEIRNELTALHAMKVRIDERVRALEAILVPLDFGQAALPFMTLTRTGARVENVAAVTPERTNGNGNLYASTGLRAAILDLLRVKGPMRAPDVAKALAAHGFKNDSKTKLATRVYNDLWRMGEVKVVANNNGVFSLV